LSRRCTTSTRALPLRRTLSSRACTARNNATLRPAASRASIGASLDGLFALPPGLFNNRRNSGGTDEHAIALLTFKITFALYGSIVLPSRFIQLDPYPVTRCEVSCPDKADGSLSAVSQTDHLAGGEVSHPGKTNSGYSSNMIACRNQDSNIQARLRKAPQENAGPQVCISWRVPAQHGVHQPWNTRGSRSCRLCCGLRLQGAPAHVTRRCPIPCLAPPDLP